MSRGSLCAESADSRPTTPITSDGTGLAAGERPSLSLTLMFACCCCYCCCWQEYPPPQPPPTCFCFSRLHKPLAVFISRFTCSVLVVSDVVVCSMFLYQPAIKRRIPEDRNPPQSQNTLLSPFWKYICHCQLVNFLFFFCMKLLLFMVKLYLLAIECWVSTPSLTQCQLVLASAPRDTVSSVDNGWTWWWWFSLFFDWLFEVWYRSMIGRYSPLDLTLCTCPRCMH